jgi:hypothetical protein
MIGREGVNGATLLVLTIIMLGVVRPSAMQEKVADAAKPGFETASMTRNTSGTTWSGAIRFQPKGGGLHATNVTLAELVSSRTSGIFLTSAK